MENEIRKLIDKYEKLLHDHKYPIDMTTYEQNRLEGYDAAIIVFISQLKDVLYRSSKESTLKDKLGFTE